MDNELRKITVMAELDQAMAAARSFATLVRAYHQALKEEGFTSFEALRLTSDYQMAMMTRPPDPKR